MTIAAILKGIPVVLAEQALMPLEATQRMGNLFRLGLASKTGRMV